MPSSPGSDIDGDSSGEIRSHLRPEKGMRHSRGELEERYIHRRGSIGSPRSSKKRVTGYKGMSSKESGHSVRRPTDLPQPVSTRYKNAQIRDLPSCPIQTFPWATEPPLSLKYEHTLLRESTKKRDGMRKAADVLLTLQGRRSGDVEIDHSELAGWEIFARRGFGAFQVRMGSGLMAKN